MPQNPPMTGLSHPAPHRDRAPYVSLAFGLFAAPIGWALHLLVNYSIAGQNCVGASAAATASAQGAHSVILLIDLAAVILSVVAGAVAYDLWKKTREEKAGDAHRLVQAGEGRTRFLALCGILTSILFGLAVIVDVLGILVGPPC